MRFDLPYGNTQVSLDIPGKNILSVIADDRPVIAGDEESIIRRALSEPIGKKPLRESAKGKKSAVILASDITRPAPSYKFLPFIVDELKSAGVADIKVIIGLGIHRKHTEEERKKLVGKKVYSSCDVMDSDQNRCRSLGKTSFKTPVELFEEALGSDMLIATGNIEYHYFAGYSGGAKAVMPGISSKAAITNNHSYMLCDSSCAANIKDNPVRNDIEEAGKLAGIDYIFNVILDDNKRIIDAVAGANDEAFLEGVYRYDSYFMKETDKAADMVIVSAGGFPKDINLYQSHKAIENVKDIVKQGGSIVLVAECKEGFGEETFKKWMFKAKDYKRCKKDIEEDFVLGGHKAAAISKILSGIEVVLFSTFDGAVSRDMGFKKTDSLQDHIDKALSIQKDTSITVVPTGRLVKLKSKN